MKLLTQIPLEKSTGNLIDYKSKMLLLGSCFVENIGKKLDYYKFENIQNPFGILFHPKAIETLVLRAIQNVDYTEDQLFFHKEQWHAFDAHSQLSDSSKANLISSLKSKLQLTKHQLKEASHIVVTLGTAWVYTSIDSGLPVANCHKLPQQNFKKELLSITQITETLQHIYHSIKSINPRVTLIFTVSPIRHIKDGFIENTRSKAHLIAAIHNVIDEQSESGCFYFPSYEIMMDELRDYRFYTEDMLHPNATAINYIWEKFQHVWMSDHALKTMEEVDTIQKGMAHRPFNQNSEAHAEFLKQLDGKKSGLQKKFPHIIF